MSQNKQKNFFIGYGAVTAVIAGVLGYMGLSASGAREETAATLEAKTKELASIKGKPVFPKDEFARKLTEKVDAQRDAVDKLHAAVEKYMLPAEATVDAGQVQSKLVKYTDQLKALAAAGPKVNLPPKEGFAMGLGRYVSAAPTASAAPYVNFVLEGVNYLATDLIRSGVSSIDVLEVPEMAWEKDAPAPAAPNPADRNKAKAKSTKGKTDPNAKPTGKKADAPALDESVVMDRYRVLIQFTGAEAAVQEALNRLASSGEGAPFFVINNMRIENEQKDGPTKQGSFQPTPVEGANRATTSDGAAAPIDPEVIDLRFILGSEKVTVFLDLDLLSFHSVSHAQEVISGKAAAPAAPATSPN
jgi:hypothetical protein